MASDFQFDEAKTTQAACLLLKLRHGRMHYLKLLKLLYLADREALLRWGIPITWDQYVSMDNGPVPSQAYNLVVEDIPKPNWNRHISPPMGDYEVELINSPAETNLLSRAEENLIQEIYQEYGAWNRWQLVDMVHSLPEWRNPHGSTIPITHRDILQAGGNSGPEIQDILTELDAAAKGRKILSGTA